MLNSGKSEKTKMYVYTYVFIFVRTYWNNVNFKSCFGF